MKKLLCLALLVSSGLSAFTGKIGDALQYKGKDVTSASTIQELGYKAIAELKTAKDYIDMEGAVVLVPRSSGKYTLGKIYSFEWETYPGWPDGPKTPYYSVVVEEGPSSVSVKKLTPYQAYVAVNNLDGSWEKAGLEIIK